MVQEQLWATAARPEKLSIVVERLWLAGDDVASVTAVQVPTKGDRGAWAHAVTYQGPLWRTVVDAEVSRLVAMHTGDWWSKKPAKLTYADWIDHLET